MPEKGVEEPPVGVNRRDYLLLGTGGSCADCATGVLNEEVENVRVLIIDKASTKSVDVAQQLAAESSGVEVVVHRRNPSQHASFNEGIDCARSRYFGILDACDLSRRDGRVARLVEIG